MQTSNKELMAQARAALSGKWQLAVGVTALIMLISLVLNSVPGVGFIVAAVLTGPLMVGINLFFLKFSRKEKVKVELLLSGFERFGTAVLAYILMAIFVLLWALLLIIPGIIAALAYSQTYFILAENKNMEAIEAIRKSKEMMRGNKWKLFCLGWRFLGWGLLCVFTFGIGFLWLYPYTKTTMAKFYDDIKDTKEEIVEVIITETSA